MQELQMVPYLGLISCPNTRLQIGIISAQQLTETPADSRFAAIGYVGICQAIKSSGVTPYKQFEEVSSKGTHALQLFISQNFSDFTKLFKICI